MKQRSSVRVISEPLDRSGGNADEPSKRTLPIQRVAFCAVLGFTAFVLLAWATKPQSPTPSTTGDLEIKTVTPFGLKDETKEANVAQQAAASTPLEEAKRAPADASEDVTEKPQRAHSHPSRESSHSSGGDHGSSHGSGSDHAGGKGPGAASERRAGGSHAAGATVATGVHGSAGGSGHAVSSGHSSPASSHAAGGAGAVRSSSGSDVGHVGSSSHPAATGGHSSAAGGHSSSSGGGHSAATAARGSSSASHSGGGGHAASAARGSSTSTPPSPASRRRSTQPEAEDEHDAEERGGGPPPPEAEEEAAEDLPKDSRKDLPVELPAESVTRVGVASAEGGAEPRRSASNDSAANPSTDSAARSGGHRPPSDAPRSVTRSIGCCSDAVMGISWTCWQNLVCCNMDLTEALGLRAMTEALGLRAITEALGVG
ncbi:hypothetical protein CYMTET_24657, partial [Cymbomonas tetramitiformis]